MNNDAKGLTFLTLSIVFLWLVFDDFVGKKRLSNVAKMMTPDLSLPSPSELVDKAVDQAKETGTNIVKGEYVKETANKVTNETSKQVGDMMTNPPFKVSGQTQQTLNKLKEADQKRKKTGAYKDKGWLNYSWEDLWNDVTGWFK